MVSNSLEVTLEADTDPVDEAIEAVNELDESLTRLESRGISIDVSGPASDQRGQTVRIDLDTLDEIGDLAAEAVAEALDVDAERVVVYEVSAPNQVRFEVAEEDADDPPPDDESTDRDSAERGACRGVSRALREFRGR